MGRQFLVLIFFLLMAGGAMAQSRTTNAFHDEHDEALALFFYRNTLRMFNMNDNPKLDELIRDIEKMKFLRISKSESEFSRQEYNALVSEYHSEDFEDLMNMRADGSNFNVFIKEKNKVTEGLVVLLDSDDDFAILDIKGAVPLNRLVELVNYVKTAEDFNFDWD